MQNQGMQNQGMQHQGQGRGNNKFKGYAPHFNQGPMQQGMQHQGMHQGIQHQGIQQDMHQGIRQGLHSRPMQQGMQECTFFLQGNCTKGNACRYQHPGGQQVFNGQNKQYNKNNNNANFQNQNYKEVQLNTHNFGLRGMQDFEALYMDNSGRNNNDIDMDDNAEENTAEENDEERENDEEKEAIQVPKTIFERCIDEDYELEYTLGSVPMYI